MWKDFHIVIVGQTGLPFVHRGFEVSFTEDNIQQAAGLIAEVYSQIILGETDNRLSYLAYTSDGTPFGIERHTYERQYRAILSLVFSIPATYELWSEDAAENALKRLLAKLATQKVAQTSPDFLQTARAFLDQFLQAFEARKTYIPINGLSVSKPLTVRDVTFLPLAEAKASLTDTLGQTLVEDLHPIRDSIALVEVSAEDQRATEVARERVEYALNILRYMGSLVWHDQPRRHIYVAGREPKRLSYALAVPPSGIGTLLGRTEFTPLPFSVDDEFLMYAQVYDFPFVLSLASDSTPSELVQSFLLALQWYGDGLQDLTDLFAFAKFYIAIETALKKPSERAKAVLPRRLSVLIEPHIKKTQAPLEKDLEDLVDERNAVFHSGSPIEKRIEYLAWFTRIMSMQCLHHLRIHLERDAWQTKDDLDAWVASNHDKYLK
jgi:hypothetical protein